MEENPGLLPKRPPNSKNHSPQFQIIPKERNMATAKKRKPAAKSAAKKAPAKKAPARKSAGKSSNGKRSGGSDYTTYSGKFTVRLPRSLHQALVDRAEKEGVSLNLFVTNALSRTVAGAGGKKK
jgi:predicted HicB family RNase H-like nuclease